jgi:phosphatidylserine/phosphatidylglycerophosphate/cardiolipin synthase-like enzyme
MRRRLALSPLLALPLALPWLALGACSSSNGSAPGPSDAGDASSPAVDASSPDAHGDASATDALAPACNDTDPRSVPLVLSVQPDDGEGPIVNVVAGATRSIRVMIYDLGTSQILTTLLQKAMAGVKVQAILDQTEMAYDQPAYDALKTAGAQVMWSNPKFSYTHAKTIVVDESSSVVSTGNFDDYDISSNRDFTFVDRDPQDVANLVTIFDSDWANVTPDLSCTRLVVSPVNSQARILALINSAQKTLDIEQLEFGDTDVQAAVVERARAGVAVRLILSDPGFESGILTAVSSMEAAGITPRDLVNPNLHLKSILVDGTTEYAGSENMSYTSLNDNREVGLIFSQPDIIATIQATFEKDWAATIAYPGSNPPPPADGGGGVEAGGDAGTGVEAGGDAANPGDAAIE